MFDKLPSEVKAQIFEYLPSNTLRDLYNILPTSDAWKAFIAKKLYRHVTTDKLPRFERLFSDFRSNATYISLEELKKLASGDIEAEVEHLELRYFDGDIKDLTKSYPDFLKTIPRITLASDEYENEIYRDDVNSDNLTEVNVEIIWDYRSYEVTTLGGIEFDELPSNLEVLRVNLVGEDIQLRNLPKTIKSIGIAWTNRYLTFPNSENYESDSDDEIDYMGNVLGWELPDTLSRLSLSSCSKAGLKLPKQLTYLTLNGCGIEASDVVELDLPSNLKELNLDDNPIKDVTGIDFPPFLEILLLAKCGIESLKNVVFPGLLVSLDISLNQMQDLEGVSFPDLKVLKLHRKRKIKSFESADLWNKDECARLSVELIKQKYVDPDLLTAEFPQSLEELSAVVSLHEWKGLVLLKNLKSMEISLAFNGFEFPPDLEELTLHCGRDLEYSKLQLPQTIQKLSISGGTSSIFNWNLPLLRELSLKNFHGEVEVPKSVEFVDLRPKNKPQQVKEEVDNSRLGTHIKFLD